MVMCEDCNIEMVFEKQKVMIGKVWNEYRCPKCKNTYSKAIAYVKKD